MKIKQLRQKQSANVDKENNSEEQRPEEPTQIMPEAKVIQALEQTEEEKEPEVTKRFKVSEQEILEIKSDHN